MEIRNNENIVYYILTTLHARREIFTSHYLFKKNESSYRILRICVKISNKSFSKSASSWSLNYRQSWNLTSNRTLTNKAVFSITFCLNPNLQIIVFFFHFRVMADQEREIRFTNRLILFYVIFYCIAKILHTKWRCARVHRILL